MSSQEDGHFKAKSRQLKRDAARLFKAAPEPMKAFQSLMVASSKEGKISSRHKELMALAIAIAMRCEGCILHHVEAAKHHGAARDELVETICISIEMGGGPATVYGAIALAAFDEESAS